MADGFLGRWSQRKQAVREGRPLDEPVAPKPVPPHVGQETPAPAAVMQPAVEGQDATLPPPPSMEDVKGLTAQSDYKPFVARDVAPEVRNAAMKKLFADPHYNVMDRLDIYIDDYSKPDPLPESMLRQMASAKFLNLFDDKEEDEAKARAALRDDANTPHVQFVAQSGQSPHIGLEPATEQTPPARDTDHDNTDLRLQQDDTPGPQQPGGRTE